MKAPVLLSRREVASGLLAIPALAAMLRSARAAAQGMSPPRLCFVYFGNGMHPQWTPPANGASFGALAPMLAPLEQIRSDLCIIKNANLLSTGGAGHSMSALATLTGVYARNVPQNAGLTNNQITNPHSPSLDQVVASRLQSGAFATPLPSLHVANLALAPTAESGPVITFTATNPVVPLAPERDPLAAFTRVLAKFNAGGGGASDGGMQTSEAQKLYAARKSVLDAVRVDVARLNARVSTSDRAQLDAYLTTLRSVEQGFELPPPLPPGTPPPPPLCPSAPPAPTAGPLTLSNLASMPFIMKRHLDTVAFALSCGLTRVATVQMSDGSLNYAAPWLGLSTNTHSSSHYAAQPNPTVALAEVATLQAYWLSELVYLVKKLKSVPDASGGTVLDHALVVTTTQNGDSQPHSGKNTPVFIAGSGGGRIPTGGRLLDAGGRFTNDVLVSLAQAMGLSDITRFGDSGLTQGPLPGLLA